MNPADEARTLREEATALLKEAQFHLDSNPRIRFMLLRALVRQCQEQAATMKACLPLADFLAAQFPQSEAGAEIGIKLRAALSAHGPEEGGGE